MYEKEGYINLKYDRERVGGRCKKEGPFAKEVHK